MVRWNKPQSFGTPGNLTGFSNSILLLRLPAPPSAFSGLRIDASTKKSSSFFLIKEMAATKDPPWG